MTNNPDAKKYRTERPNITDDLGLSPHLDALYGHYLRVCGANGGECTESVRTTAGKKKMSIGEVSTGRRELVRIGLITAEKRGSGISVKIVDIWDLNLAYYELKNRPSVDGWTVKELQEWLISTSQKPAKTAESNFSAFLHGDALRGAMNAQSLEQNTKIVLTKLAIVLEKEPSLKAELAKNAENPEQLFIMLSRCLREEERDCITYNSCVEIATFLSTPQSVHILNISRNDCSPPERNVHQVNENAQKCSPGETKKEQVLKKEPYKKLSTKKPPLPVIPSVQVFVKVTGKHILNKVQMETLAEKIGDSTEDLERWGNVVKAWLNNGYSPKNITGMLDWFANGIPVHQKKQVNGHYGNGKVQTTPPQQPSFDPEREARLRRIEAALAANESG